MKAGTTAHPAVPSPGIMPVRTFSPPVEMIDLEITEDLPQVNGPALVLARVHDHPIGTVAVGSERGVVAPADLEAEIRSECAASIAAHLALDGLPDSALRPRGLDAPPDIPPCLRRREEIHDDAPRVSVIVATRDRPDLLRTCLISLSKLTYPNVEIIVVDNAPSTGETRRLVLDEFDDSHVLYAVEHRRGLASAHNCGVDRAQGRYLAFIDDDATADPDWLTSLVAAFRSDPRIAAVTGLIHPAELRTHAQLLLENHGGFAKGFVPRLFDLDHHRPGDPLFPLTAGKLGSGANMAFDAGVLRSLGGFDPAMGTGTPARGGDDLLAFHTVITHGHRLAYEPSAVVFHRHRDDEASLKRQAFGYGVGLGAYLCNVMLHDPKAVLGVARHLPGAFREAVDPSSGRNATRYDGWPPRLALLERRGIALGPAAYLVSRIRHQRAHRQQRARPKPDPV